MGDRGCVHYRGEGSCYEKVQAQKRRTLPSLGLLCDCEDHYSCGVYSTSQQGQEQRSKRDEVYWDSGVN